MGLWLSWQVEAVLFGTGADRLHPYIVVSLLTGARTEELRALRWEHVHLKGLRCPPPVTPYMEVRRSVREGGDTKTRKSRRTLALPVPYIDAMRTQQAAERLAAGRPGRTAGSYSPQGMEPRWTRPTSAATSGERSATCPGSTPAEWTPRELRHSFVSVLSDASIPVDQIAQPVGPPGR
jgi:integrase